MQLSTQCAAIDLSGPDLPSGGRAVAAGSPGLVAAAVAYGGAAPPGTIGGRPCGRRRAAGHTAEPAWVIRPGTRQRQAVAGRDSFRRPAAAGAVPRGGRGTGRRLASASQEAGAAPAARTPDGRQASVKAQLGARRLLALLTMAVAVAASVLLPVAGTVVAMTMIVLLRAADRAHGGLTRRRSARGGRASDVPGRRWLPRRQELFRALVSTALLAPLALACAVAAAAITIVAIHANPYRAAGAYAAEAFVACYGFGLGSGKPRGQLGRLFGAVARNRFPAALTVILLTVLAAGVTGAAITQAAPPIAELAAGFSWHMPGLRHVADQVAFRLHHL